MKEYGDWELEVYNSVGGLVSSQKINGSVYYFTDVNVRSGMYFFQIRKEGQYIGTKRVIFTQ